MVRLQRIGNAQIDRWIEENVSSDGKTYATISCEADSMVVVTSESGDSVCIPRKCIVTDITEQERTASTDLIQMSLFNKLF